MSTAPKSFPPEYFRQVKDDGYSNGRSDNRTNDEHRKLFMKSSIVESAQGSSYVEIGETKVVCTVHGPHDVDKISLDEMPPNFDVKGLFMATLRFAPFSKKIRLQRTKNADTDEEQKFSKALIQAFSPAVLLDKYPKSQIDLHINVLEDDGNVLSSAFIASTLALIDAGIEIYDLVIGASCSVVSDGSLLLDPTSVEEAKTDATVTIAFMPSLNQVALTYQTGIFDPRQLIKIVKSLTDCCLLLHPLMKNLITRDFKNKNPTS